MTLQRVLLIPDTHRPYHDKRAYALMMKVAKDFKPHEIYLLGDYADFYSVTGHQKHPKLVQFLQEEIQDVKAGLAELMRKFPRADITYILGNHEDRLFRYIVQKCPELLDTLSIETMLTPDIGTRHAKAGKVRFIPYTPAQRVRIGKSSLYARHTPFSTSPKATLARSLCSLVYGHIHRIEEAFSVGLDGKPITAFSVGCLVDATSDAFAYVKGHHQWQHGFGVVYINPKTKHFHHQKVHILPDYSCVFNGKLYR